MVGKKVQQYQFLEKLGEGGMGEIYRAQDTRLNRFVAIKCLTSAKAGDTERRRRFIQEAQAASALNHPNIITIHDILSQEGADFLVMEYVQGRTLVDEIPKGGLRTPQVIKMGIQMADALQTAHAAGIIHRDLKPANFMVTSTGLVKILDFGLAKLTDTSPMAGDADDATKTIADAPLTVEGSIIGTVSYMSPEQAQGQKVDARSDIFSFGLVLYEMITGQRAFRGDSAVSTLTAILRDEVKPISESNPDTPPELEEIVWRCLRKDPDERFQSMTEVHAALSLMKHESESALMHREQLAKSGIGDPGPRSGARGPASSSRIRPPSSAGAPPAEESKSGNLLFGLPNKVVLGGMVGIMLLVVIVMLVRNSSQPAAPTEQAAAGTDADAAQMMSDAAADELAGATLTNQIIMAMVDAGVPSEVILSQIKNSPNEFRLLPADIIALTGAGVPGFMIEAMRDPSSIPDVPFIPEDLAEAGAPPKGPPPKGAPKAPPKQATASVKSGSQPSSKTKQAPPKQSAKNTKSSPPPETAKAAVKAADTKSKEAASDKVLEARAKANQVRAQIAMALARAKTVAPETEEAEATDVELAPAQPEMRQVTLKDGMPITIRLSADVPNDTKKGATLRFVVGAEVRADGAVVLRPGAPVVGEVTKEPSRGFLFGGSDMMMNLSTATAVDGSKIQVRALPQSDPDGETERPVKTGKPPPADGLAANAGTEYVAYVDGDTQIEVPVE